jgi:amino acid adenylation domain-containing protein
MTDLSARLERLSPAKRLLMERLARAGAAAPAEGPELRPRSQAGPVPLSFAQQRLWFLDRLEPGTPFYTIPFVCRLRGPVDPRALRSAYEGVVRRHEALRTVFAEEDGRPVQAVLPDARAPFHLADLRPVPATARGAETRRRVRDFLRLPWDLARGPLVRAFLARTGDEEWTFALALHHVVSDGWSHGILVREMSAVYAAALSGGEAQLPAPEVQYADYALWQRERMAGAVLEEQLAYWRRTLADAPTQLELPADRPRPAVRSHHGAKHFFTLPAEAFDALAAVARAEGASPFMALLAVFQLLLARLAGEEEVLVGTPVANRERRETEGTVGFFANTLVLRGSVGGDPTFRTLLARARETALGAFSHQELPFERLVEELQPERSLGHSPLFQVLFSYLDAAGEALRLPGCEVEEEGADLGVATLDLDLALRRTAAGVSGVLRYSTELFDAATAARTADRFLRLVRAAAADPDARVSTLPLLDEAEREQVLGAWSASPAQLPATPVHQLVAEQAARTPGALAVAAGDARLTYAELMVHADALAARLRALGVGPESRVALCLERSAEMVVALLATLRAGGAYVPLDPEYPADRLAFMLSDSGATVLLTQARLRDRLPEFGGDVVEVGGTAGTPHPPAPSPTRGEGEHDDSRAQEALPQNGGRVASPSEPGGGPLPDASASSTRRESEAPLPLAGEGLGRGPAIAPSSLAYVIYTSGSTGTPKGVGVPHGALANHTQWMQREWPLAPGDRVLQKTPFSFDASVWEFWSPLAAGATLVMAEPGAHREPAALARALTDEGITVVQFVPSLLGAVLDEDLAAAVGVRRVFCGGEALPAEMAARARAALGAEVVNLYGPTEACIDATATVAADANGGAGATVPIGRPVANARAYVLDAAGGPVPPGVPGELYLGGAGLARGYLDRPDLTAERFVPDALSGEAGARLYRTGDRVRWLPGGEMEYLGRADQQVKLRGFRVEPGEVEATLLRHPTVRAAVAMVREDAGRQSLVAYLVADGAAPDAAELREWAARSLPQHMVPSGFVVLDALPTTPSGKLDRRALPAPEAVGEGNAEAPRTQTEEVLAAIWGTVLGAARVGREDDFFALGGHSLLATQVVSRVRAAFGVELPVRAVFASPTLAGLAAEVEAAQRAGAGIELPSPVAGTAGDDPPLSFAQERLWFLDRLEPGSATYHVPLRLRLRGALDAAALRRALDAVVARHEPLRTSYPASAGHPVQRIAPPAGVPLPTVDLSRLDGMDRGREAERIALGEARAPFDLAGGPVLRARLLRLDAGEHALLLTLHHVATDGWSTGVLVRDLAALYRAGIEGAAPALAPLPLRYADYAVWQRGWLEGGVLERQLAWWTGRLADAPPVLALPLDRPRTAVRSGRGAVHRVAFPAELRAGLAALSRREGATLFMTLLAGWQLVLARFTGEDDVVVGTPIAGRRHHALEELVGFFVNTLALRTDLGGDPSFRELLARVRETTLGAYAHQDLPFERLIEALHPERALGHTPVVQVAFGVHAAPRHARELPGLELAVEEVDPGTAKWDLGCTLAEGEDGISGGIRYPTDLFDAATVERIAAHFAALLERAVRDPAAPLSRVAALPDGERRAMEAWNDTARPFSGDRCIHQLFAARAALAPGAVALVSDAGTLTYAELDRAANRVAHAVLRHGAGPEARVALCMEPAPETVAALIGVLRAGAAYVPLDPAAPADRTAYQLEDSGARLVLAHPHLAAGLPAGVPVLPVEPEPFPGEPEHAPSSPVLPENLAYVIYTSGSTGRPKGVLVPHRGVCNTIEAYVREYRIDAASRVLLFAPIHFDASLTDLFTPLFAGGALVVPSRETRVAGPELIGFLERHRVTHAKFTPSFLAALPDAELPDLRAVMSGSEACTAEVVARWAPGRRFVNGYGPTETSVRVTAVECTDGTRTPPIGRPVANARLYVLDARGEEAPVGVPGELHVGGTGVTRGYLGRPDLTAERFLPDPFSPEAGARMYRSGDRARWLPDGNLDFVGRVDFQVKIRGFRIEPGEVEAALLEHPGLADTVVVAREGAGGVKRLVAYVVAAAGTETPDAAELRAFAKRRLPEYMVPGAFVALDALPLTSRGKIDRGALPEPEGAAEGEAYVEPSTPTEEVLAGIYAAVLGAARVGAGDDFFALGGHSLLATRVTARIRDAFGMEPPLRALFEAPTVAGLAARVDALLREGDGSAAPPVVPVPRDGSPLPPSFGQQRLWFVDRMEPGSAAYNSPHPLRLRGRFDPAVLARALAELARRHETLRTVFADIDGEPVQVVRAPGPVPLPCADLSGLSATERERELARLVEEEAARPFDLETGPLLRAGLVALAEDDHALLLDVHHAVADGWSFGVLYRELSALYGAFAAGQASPLPELPVQYADFAVWQRAWLTGDVLERQLAWWRERLADAPPLLELPTDRPRAAGRSRRAAAEAFSLAPSTLRALRGLAREEGATLYMVLLAGWQATLARWSDQDDVVVGSPVAGRTRTETEGLVGFFVNTLALRTDLGGTPTFRALLARVRETTLGAYAHQDLPFERLVETLGIERSLAHAPLVQVVLALQNVERVRLRLGDAVGEPIPLAQEDAKFDLTLALAERDGALAGMASYAEALWDAATVRRLLAHFARFLEAVAADPAARAADVELLTPAERAQLVGEWSATGTPDPAPRCIHVRFAEQAERRPNAVALVFGRETVTYGELHRRSDALARRLAALGVGPDVRVGICLPRSPEMVVGLLGILKAGGAYVPLDPQYPAERLAFMLADADAPVLLTQAGLAERFSGYGGVVLGVETPLPPAPSPARGEGENGDTSAQEALPHSWGRVASLSEPGGGPSPEALAYVIYTSGSTGEPKGTEVPHRAIPGFFEGADYVRFDEEQVLLQHSSTSWDALTLELWPALLTGGRCVLYPEQTADPEELGRQVREHGVTTLWLTAAYFNLVVDSFPGVLEGVRQVMVGGEAVSVPHVRRALELYPELRLVNGYGPSECTVFASAYPVPHGFAAATVPIGRPVGDRRVYLLDRGLNPVPVGVPGELYVGGPSVARGYLNRPVLTAERFVPDPFSGEPGARMYRSGDRVRWRADGLLEFVGRTDFQVKVRGFRVEPGEVEGVLASHPAVREAAVVVRGTGGDRRLVGYVTAETAGGVTAAELRSHLVGRLPEYMVPAALVVLDAMPLTAHGKTDRRALPEPGPAAEADGFVPPRTPTEEVLAGTWAAVLGIERVGAHDDFFALGGHSLLATRVVSRVRGAFGVELPLRALFEAPSLAGLAARVDALLREGAALPLPPVVPVPREGELPLSFAQQRLWFVQQLDPDSSAYNVRTALRIRGPLDVPALERALSEVVRRHETLRTRFPEREGRPEQVIDAPVPVRAARVELAGLAAGDRERALAGALASEGARPFDLARGPLLRALLARLGGEDHALLLTVHHVVFDGWSAGVLFRELSALYEAYASGAPSPLPEPPVQYADFAVWQRARLSDEALEGQLDWWTGRLAGAPPLLELPTDRPRSPAADAREEEHRFTIPAATVEGLRGLAGAEGGTLFMAVLAGFAALLGRYAGQDDVVVGTPIAGRTRAETEGLIGFFVNTLALRTDLGGAPSFRVLLARVREATLGAYQHQDLPFERLVEALGIERSLAHNPLFQVSFALQNVEVDEPRLGAASAERIPVGKRAAQFDLSLALVERGGALAGSLGYRSALWDAATAERMAAHLCRLLAGVAADPGRPVAEVELADAAERDQVLRAWNATAAPFPRERTVAELFAEAAARTPDAPAVLQDGEGLTYAELDARAGRLAAYLRSLGVGPEVRAAVCLERTPAMIVAVLAVLRAGGAYVPLDPGNPPERIAHLLRDSGAAVLLVRGSTAELGSEFEGVTVDVDARLEQAPTPSPSPNSGRGEHDDADLRSALPHSWGRVASPSEPGGGPSPENLAYVVYTSGSTGAPKGVCVAQRSLVNYVHAARERFAIGTGDRVLQFASLAFDASAEEIFPALLGGAALVLRTEEMIADGRRFLEGCAGQGVTVLDLPTAYWHELVAEMEGEGLRLPGCVRLVIVGGERALPERVAAWHRMVGGGVRLVNTYGPTEATIVATAAELRREESAPSGTEAPPVPIGRPVANARAYVLDPLHAPAPVGVPGELYVGGIGVARGYLGRPELTAARFLPDPFADEPGARMYRTGDRARWRADGEMEYLGRVDQQVKVRGFRIEPAEVEAALLRAPGVAEAVVQVREDTPGDARLVAYVVPSVPGEASEDPLREILRRTLPDYMVPAGFVLLDRIPLTRNGKVDRRALAAPTAGEAHGDAPRTPTEELLAGIFAEVLGAARVGVRDDFFGLGGHSLLAMRAVSRVRTVLGAELPVRALFEAPTVAGLAPRVDEAVRAGQGMHLPPLARVPRGADLPLSFAQERLWFLHRLDPASVAYNMPLSFRLRGALDVEALRRSVAVVLQRHESLRTVFPATDGPPVQRVLPVPPNVLTLVDLSALPETQREAEGRRAADALAWRRYDLAAGPLFEAGLIRLSATEHLCVLGMHHVVSDGWSAGVLLRELSAAYAACTRGETPRLPELPVQYADYAVWQRAWLTGETLERQLAWWRERLGGAPPLLELPTDRPRPAVQGTRAGSVPLHLPADVAEGLRALARREGATPFMALLAAFQLLLARWSGAEDVVVGTPVAGRTHEALEGIVGFFINTLALRADLSGDPTFGALLAQVREATLGAYAHQELPFERLVEELGVQRSVAHAPLVQAAFSLQNLPERAATLGTVAMEPFALAGDSAKLDLTAVLVERGGTFSGTLQYAADLFDRATAERMAAGFAALAAAIVAIPDARVSALSPLSTGERRRVLEAGRGPEREPEALLVHEQVAGWARRTPEAPAVLCGGERVSYVELDSEAERIAGRLRTMGVGPEVRVGLALERSPRLVAAALGVMKAGGAYLPLDPDYPADRLRYMLEDGGVAVVLTESSVEDRMPQHDARILRLDDPGETGEASTVSAAGAEAGRDGLAYVIYTSGSTGRPKGTLVTRGALADFLDSTAASLEVGPGTVTGAVASYAFDVWTLEVLLPLRSGAAVRIVPRASALDDARLLDEFADVDTVTLVPAFARHLRSAAHERPERAPRLRCLTLGGDSAPPELLRDLRATFPAARLRIFYGPTETTVAVTEHRIGEALPDRVMIGQEMPGVRGYVLDAAGEPVPQGVHGELYVGGPQVGRGYLRRPELTAERFLPDPFAGEPGARMYRTGDRVRRLETGALEFLGRADHQVKIRGHRIETGEIEAVLERHPGVTGAVVLAREDAPGDRRLVAYLEAAGGVEEAGIRSLAREHLPEYMVPSAVVVLERFPLTPTGKTDRAALPTPEAAPRDPAGEAPATAAERTIAAVWEEVLGVRGIGVEEGFFDLGGNSLLLVRLSAKLQEALGTPVPVIDLFQHTTVRALARHVAGTAEEPAAPASEERAERLARGRDRLGKLRKRT